MVAAVQSNMRTAAVEFMNDFTQDAGIKLQVYRARPATIYPPTGFVDRMGDQLVSFVASTIFQHVAFAEVVILHGEFDHGDTVDQRDRFVDGFLDWVRTRFHQAGANTLIAVRTVEDDPTYVPDWIPVERRKTYYATTIRLEVEQSD